MGVPAPSLHRESTDSLITTLNTQCSSNLASFPGSPPRAHNYCMTFDPHEKSGGEPGRFYHVSDVSGRETVERLELGVGGTTVSPTQQPTAVS